MSIEMGDGDGDGDAMRCSCYSRHLGADRVFVLRCLVLTGQRAVTTNESGLLAGGLAGFSRHANATQETRAAAQGSD